MMMTGFRLNLTPLKEPLGFIKILEWLTAIFAFGSCGSYSGQNVISLFCGGGRNETLNVTFHYPFRLNEVMLVGSNSTLCGRTVQETHLVGDSAFSAEVFVAVAILAFCYCMAALLIYLGYMDSYRNPQGSSWSQTDFILTIVFVALWLVCSSAWAKGLQNVRDATSTAGIQSTLSVCQAQGVVCQVTERANMRTLSVSVVFGFLNLILWLGNVWFTYKETPWHSQTLPAEAIPVCRQVPVPI
ncbi:synaptophysin-like protein 1 [Clupea harengus]|uniref:Synaptophysin-like protein 1 n=1 Tax=Clupea harengus TaxID=7950 RepID=A0A6P8EX30_CLUHA|nr:synaptophysin-like protein 1 [Clupea harengus]